VQELRDCSVEPHGEVAQAAWAVHPQLSCHRLPWGLPWAAHPAVQLVCQPRQWWLMVFRARACACGWLWWVCSGPCVSKGTRMSDASVCGQPPVLPGCV